MPPPEDLAGAGASAFFSSFGASSALAEAAGADDLVVALISGGGSSLLTAPAGAITLAEKQALNAALLASGAPIDEMNAVRKHVSAIKGGRLAVAAYPARVATLTISDVPGDDPATIASGPTVADPTTFADALDVIRRRGVEAPAAVIAHLEAALDETPKAGDPRLARAEHAMIGAPRLSLEAAAEVARRAGIEPVMLGDALEGEARELGAEMARDALSRRGGGKPLALLSGGETTVTLPKGAKPKGRGGRNVEFLLSLAATLDGAKGISAISCDTDGVDGMAEVAGAIVDEDTPRRAAAAGVDVAAALADHDGHGFFEAVGDQVVTGPTLTNVNDFRAVLIR